jgi:hypothetical protein
MLTKLDIYVFITNFLIIGLKQVLTTCCDQGRLNSIIDPHAKQCILPKTTTHSNKNVNVDKIKHIFIALVLPTKSVFKH